MNKQTLFRLQKALFRDSKNKTIKWEIIYLWEITRMITSVTLRQMWKLAVLLDGHHNVSAGKILLVFVPYTFHFSHIFLFLPKTDLYSFIFLTNSSQLHQDACGVLKHHKHTVTVLKHHKHNFIILKRHKHTFTVLKHHKHTCNTSLFFLKQDYAS